MLNACCKRVSPVQESWTLMGWRSLTSTLKSSMLLSSSTWEAPSRSIKIFLSAYVRAWYWVPLTDVDRERLASLDVVAESRLGDLDTKAAAVNVGDSLFEFSFFDRVGVGGGGDLEDLGHESAVGTCAARIMCLRKWHHTLIGNAENVAYYFSYQQCCEPKR